VTVRDANLCTATFDLEITEPDAPVSVAESSMTAVTCNGGSDGSFTVAGSGGTGAYSYNLPGEPQQASGTFTGLSAGSYTVTITDDNDCTNTTTVTVTQPSALGGSIVDQTNVACNSGTSGSVTVSGSGGTPGYTFDIGDGAQVSGVFGSLSAGAHTIIVTDANMCTFEIDVFISQPASGLSLSNDSSVDVACFGDSSGSLAVSATGGTAPYEFSINGADYFSSGDFSGLPAKVYAVSVRDANGCSDMINIEITQPAAILRVSQQSVSNVKCNGGSDGSFPVTGSGGTGA
jgi:hypothetical protein